MKSFLAALLVLLIFPQAVTGKRVYDFVEVLSPEVEAALEETIASVEQQTTAQIAVVVVSSLQGETIDSYANQLFNQWGIGTQATNNGILFLIAPEERRTRIEVGYGLEPLITDSTTGQIIDDVIIPRFKEGDFSTGIIAGTHAIADILKEYPQAAMGIKGAAPLFLMTERNKFYIWCVVELLLTILFLLISMMFGKNALYSGRILLFWLSIVGVAFAGCVYAFLNLRTLHVGEIGILIFVTVLSLLCGFQNVKRYMRFRPHFCKKCGGELVLLSDDEEDKELKPAQKLEEGLGSVDYDVWKCPACLQAETRANNLLGSGLSSCPKCSARAYREVSKVVTSATRETSGSRKITGTCQSCGHTETHFEVISRDTSSGDSSSWSSGGGSSGGSFGGGSSGGGGASGGW